MTNMNPRADRTGANCIFCQIVMSTAPASVVYQDKLVMAFMDIYPLTKGHTLVIPLEHVVGVAELPKATGAHLFRMTQMLSAAVRQATGCHGVNLFVADGVAAGQDIFHFHMHILPRFEGDGLGFRHPPGYPREEPRHALDDLAMAITKALGAPPSPLA